MENPITFGCYGCGPLGATILRLLRAASGSSDPDAVEITARNIASASALEPSALRKIIEGGVVPPEATLRRIANALAAVISRPEAELAGELLGAARSSGVRFVDSAHLEESMSASDLEVGDRVKVRPGKEHMPEHKGIVGTVTAIDGTNVEVLFDGEKKPHKWYAPAELMAAQGGSAANLEESLRASGARAFAGDAVRACLVESLEKTGKRWRVVLLKEGFSGNPGMSGKNRRYYPKETVVRAAEILEGLPVYGNRVKGGGIEPIDPASGDFEGLYDHSKGTPTRKGLLGFVNNVRAELVEGATALVGDLEFTESAARFGAWLRDRFQAGRDLLDLSIKAGGWETLGQRIQGIKADVVNLLDRPRAVEFVSFGGVPGAGPVDLLESDGSLRARVYRALEQHLPAYVAGLDLATATEGEVLEKLRLAVDENLARTLDAAAVGDRDGLNRRTVFELRQAYAAHLDGRTDDLEQSLGLVLSGALAAPAAPAPVEAAPVVPPAEPTPAPASAESAATASADVATPPETPEQAQLRERAEMDVNERLAEIDRRQTALDVATMVAAAPGLPEVARSEIRESFQGKIAKPDEIQKAIDSRLRLVEALTGQGQVRDVTPQTRAELVESIKSPLDRIRHGIARGIGCKPEDFGMSHWDGAPRLGLYDGYVAMTGDKEVTGHIVPGNLEESLKRFVKLNHWERAELKEALGTSTWGEIFGDAMNKKMQREYRETPVVELQFCNKLQGIDNLYPQKLIRRGGLAKFPTRTEGNAYVEATYPADHQVTVTPTDKGQKITVNYEAIRRNDTGVVSRLPTDLQRAARLTLSDDIMLTALAMVSAPNDTPWEGDSADVYSSSRHNYSTAELDFDSADLALAEMAEQSEQQSGRSGVIVPGFIVHPARLKSMAHKIFNPRAGDLAGSTNREINPLAGNVVPLQSHRFQGLKKAHLYVADPSQNDTIAVAYLDDKEEPEILVADTPNEGLALTNRQFVWVCSWFYDLVMQDPKAFRLHLPTE